MVEGPLGPQPQPLHPSILPRQHFFEGYDQGVMGGVNASPYYVTEVGIGEPDGTVTDTVHQGGIVSVYYLGCIFGSFAGGWAADRIGRINGLVSLGMYKTKGTL